MRERESAHSGGILPACSFRSTTAVSLSHTPTVPTKPEARLLHYEKREAGGQGYASPCALSTQGCFISCGHSVLKDESLILSE